MRISDWSSDVCSSDLYVDGTARYLIVGRVYDMESRQDLTAAKLLEMNPDMLLGGAAKAGLEEESETPVPQMAAAGPAGRAAQPPAAAQKVDRKSTRLNSSH